MDDDSKIKDILAWEILEEKTEYYRDKILLLGIIGITAAILAFIFESYIFALFCLLAPSTFVYLGSRKPLKLSFKITSIGLFLEDGFIPVEKILAYNIVDDPGERARLLIRLKSLLPVNEVIPIYDVQITQIHVALRELRINQDENIGLKFFEKLNTIV